MKTLTKKQRALRNNLTAWILVAPSLIFMLVFTVYPVFRSIYLSLYQIPAGDAGARVCGAGELH